MAEATPRVHARLAGLRGGAVTEPLAPINAPAMASATAMAAATAPEMVFSPTPPARPRSISSALVPWAGARAAASRAASVAVTHGYDLRSGEASIMRRAPMALDADLWRSQEMQGPGARPPADPRWRMWRDASAALVAFALVGLVLLGGDLLRLPSGPPPATPGLAADVTHASPTPTPTTVAIVDPTVLPDTPVLTTPTPGPTATPEPAAAATPPLTGPTAHPIAPPTKRPTPTPKPTPRPTASLEPAFVCDTYTPVALQAIHCQVVAGNGGTVTYEWLASGDGTTYQAVSGGSGASVSLSFAVPGYYYLEVILKRGSTTVTSDPAAITVGPIL